MALENFSRADFLKLFWPQVSAAAPLPSSDSLLVVIFLRGGCDSLNFVSPIGGEDRKIYEQERPNLNHPLSGPEALLPLDDRFGLHPKATALHQLFKEKKLAIVHAAGLSSNTRSHFDAQNFIDLGTPDIKNTTSGWITRFLSLSQSSAQQLPAISIGPLVPTSYLNFNKAVSVTDLRRLNLAGKKNLQDEQQAIMESLYRGGISWVHEYGNEALSALKLLQAALAKQADKPNNYPKSDLSNRLQTLSKLMDLNMGIRVAALDFGGWDTHKFQGQGANGAFANQVNQLSEAVGAFFADLQTKENGKNTTVLVFSEFGRRVRENANRGTDHGHGGAFFVLGNQVNGGKVYGKWTGLSTEALYERADLPVHTDFREIIGEVLQDQFKVGKSLGEVFPDFKKKLQLKLIRV